MKLKFFIFSLLFCSFSFAQERERVYVAVPSDDESQVQTLLENIETSIDNNDYKKYASFLTKELASKNKKKFALLFFKHKLSMTLEKFEIMESDDKTIEAMVRYIFSTDGEDKTIVSMILAKRQPDGSLLLADEKLIEDSNEEKIECVGGNCKVAKNPKNEEEGSFDKMNPKGIVYFDENGDIIIEKLLQAFPDKYRPACANGKCNR